MLKPNKELWGLLNTRTEKLFVPLKIGGCWFRGFYDSEKSAKLGAKKLNENIKDLERHYKNYKEEIEKAYGTDINTFFGEYVPIEIRGVEKYEENWKK